MGRRGGDGREKQWNGGKLEVERGKAGKREGKGDTGLSLHFASVGGMITKQSDTSRVPAKLI